MQEATETTIGTTVSFTTTPGASTTAVALDGLAERYQQALDATTANAVIEEARAQLIIVDDVMADDRAEVAATVQPIPTTEVTVVNEGDPITPTAIMAERTEPTAADGDQAATALAAPEAAEAEAAPGQLVLTEASILDLIEQRLSRIGIDTSDVKEKLVAKLTAKALADRNMTAAVSDRLRSSSIFVNSLSQRIREFVINGEGAPFLERAIKNRVDEYSLEAQIASEVRHYITRSRDIQGVTISAAAGEVNRRMDSIRMEVQDLAEAPRVLADAIRPVIDQHIEAAIAQRFPSLEGSLQAAIERLNKYRESIGLMGTKLTIKSTNRRNNNGNQRLYLDTPKVDAGYWRQNSNVARIIRHLLDLCQSDGYIAYNGCEISADDFAYLISIPNSSGSYHPWGNHGDCMDRLSLEIAMETFEAFAPVSRGPWNERYVAHHIRQRTNLGLHFTALGYRILQPTYGNQSDKIVKIESSNVRPPNHQWDMLVSFAY